MCGSSSLIDATSVTELVPTAKTCGSVRFPRELVVPHSNHPAAALPPVLIVPCSSAEPAVTAVAPFVVMDGVPVSEYAATAPNKNIDTMIPKVREKFIDYPPW